MKLKQFFLFCVIFFSSVTANATNDKVLHFSISSVAGYLAETSLHSSTLVNNSDFKRVVYGTALGSVPGLIKEVIDSNEENNRFSGDDMVANISGAFVGSFIATKVNNHLNISINKESDGYYLAVVYRD